MSDAQRDSEEGSEREREGCGGDERVGGLHRAHATEDGGDQRQSDKK